MTTFAQLRRRVYETAFVGTGFFAETVTLKDRAAATVGSGAAHCRHSVRFDNDDEGNAVAVETLTVRILRDDWLTRAPKLGDLLFRAGEAIGYVYAYGGGDVVDAYISTFERRTILARG